MPLLLLLLLLLLNSNVCFVLVYPTFGFLQDLERAADRRRCVSKIEERISRQTRIVIVASQVVAKD
jgi:hypothetical protein